MRLEDMTHCERVLWWLEQRGEIDPLTAWAELGIYRLGARIHDLRRRGLNIISLRKQVRNQFGEACEVALYRMGDKTHECT